MGRINLQVGETFTFTKTFTETDVTLFSAISGDFAAIHTNEEYAKTMSYGKRILHGLLTFTLASTVSGITAVKGAVNGTAGITVRYDGVRFLKPVFHEDTISAVYTVDEINEERMRTEATIVMKNQHGEDVLTCKHIMKFMA